MERARGSRRSRRQNVSSFNNVSHVDISLCSTITMGTESDSCSNPRPPPSAFRSTRAREIWGNMRDDEQNDDERSVPSFSSRYTILIMIIDTYTTTLIDSIFSLLCELQMRVKDD